jgi:hypothetical protein
MTTTIQALKSLYVALGGTASDVSGLVTIPDMINAIAQIASSTGIELPTVGRSDDGKVLTVVNGVWTKAEPATELPEVTASDEGKVLTVNSSGEWEADSVPEELPTVTADDNGKVLKVVDGEWSIGTDLTE